MQGDALRRTLYSNKSKLFIIQVLVGTRGDKSVNDHGCESGKNCTARIFKADFFGIKATTCYCCSDNCNDEKFQKTCWKENSVAGFPDLAASVIAASAMAAIASFLKPPCPARLMSITVAKPRVPVCLNRLGLREKIKIC